MCGWQIRSFSIRVYTMRNYKQSNIFNVNVPHPNLKKLIVINKNNNNQPWILSNRKQKNKICNWPTDAGSDYKRINVLRAHRYK